MKTIKFLLAILFSIAVAACGGGGGGGGTTDTTPPTVSSVSPANSATGVALNSAITATFSEPMTASTVTSATFTLDNGVTGTVAYSGTTATFTPSSNLTASTLYTATIATGVKDAAGNAMAAAYTWSFTTGTTTDNTPPTVSSISPANSATGVAVNGAITATFSETMNASTVTSATFTVGGVTGAVTYSGTTATFTPSAPLAYSTSYTATISTGVKDAAGNAMASTYTWSFTTGAVPDTTPPTVSSTSPANSATGVAVNGAITATFSEAMDASTVTTATFTVAGVTGTVAYSGTTATFTPSAPLAYSTAYTATISTAVTDLAGNHLATAKTWSFTTGAVPDTTPPTVSSTSPANSATGVAVNGAITATFSEAMSAGTITSATFTVAGVTGTVAYSGTTATFTPSSNLAYSNAYTATISTAVTDLAGNHLAVAKTWSFTTGAVPDTTPPTVLSTSPANSATGVAVNALITATFSEAMSAGTITSATFTVAGVTGTVAYSGTTATFTPSSNLAFSTAYTATISTAVTDLAGNHLATAKTWSFTTGALPVYAVSGTVTGPWVDGLTINMTGSATGTTITGSSGNYSFPAKPNGTYTFTPAALSGYTYTPATVTISNAVPTVPAIVATSAITSYSITGTVSRTTAAGAPIAIIVYQNSCGGGCSPAGGTVIAGVGTYTVRGLQPGGYTVVAEMDTLGTGTPNATNPMGMTTTTITSSSVAGVDIVVADPGVVSPITPTGLSVAPGNGSAFIMYSPPKDANNQEIATSYKIYWGTTATALTGGGTATFTAQGDKQNFYVLSGLPNTALYFKMSAFVGATESVLSAAVPVTIGATTGANTVSGTVTFSGAATGPMIVGLFSNTGVYITRIPSPVSPQSYSIAGVPNGSYYHFAVIDMNHNGVVDIGDISNTNSNSGEITVSGNTPSSLILSSASATATVNTDHQFDGTNSYYSLILGINDGTKRTVAVTLVSGPNMAVPYDMGTNSNNSLWIWLNTVSPTVGDAYMFKVTYSDGTTENLSGSVAAVLGSGKFASSVATVNSGTGGSSATIPLFTWTAPASPPTSFTYRLHLNGNNDSTNWDYPKDNGLPSTTTPLQVLYNADGRANGSLTSGYSYNWQVQVRDANGDSATRTATYTVP